MIPTPDTKGAQPEQLVGKKFARYLLRRRDWLVWLLRPDAKLPRRWWM